MQIAFLEEQGGVGDFFNTFSDNEFWYGFLEQVVQTYGYLVDSGKIVDVPDYVQKALNRLNDYQEAYDFADSDDYKEAVETGEIRDYLFDTLGLRNLREKRNFEAIKETEEDAKLIFKEMVMEHLELKLIYLQFLGKRMMKQKIRIIHMAVS